MKKTPKWVEIGRKELGLYATGHVSGPGWSNPGYFSIVYEVSEQREPKSGSKWEDNYRTRIEQGPACRLYGEGYEAFWRLYQTYLQHARLHAKRHKEMEGGGGCFDKRFRYLGEEEASPRKRSAPPAGRPPAGSSAGRKRT